MNRNPSENLSENASRQFLSLASPAEAACHALLRFIEREILEKNAPEEQVRERCKVFTTLLNEGFTALSDKAGQNLAGLREQCRQLEHHITRLGDECNDVNRRSAEITRNINRAFDMNIALDIASRSCNSKPSGSSSTHSSSPSGQETSQQASSAQPLRGASDADE
ncbi:TPA: hypothetical protein JLF79_001862 [Escherichia coli]|nr:hypothetical protein [Escherichia coli]